MACRSNSKSKPGLCTPCLSVWLCRLTTKTLTYCSVSYTTKQKHCVSAETDDCTSCLSVSVQPSTTEDCGHTTLHCTALHYTTLHYTTLHYTTLHYTTLHYTHTHTHINVPHTHYTTHTHSLPTTHTHTHTHTHTRARTRNDDTHTLTHVHTRTYAEACAYTRMQSARTPNDTQHMHYVQTH